MRVLVVGKPRIAHGHLVPALQRQEHSVTTVDTGAAALRALRGVDFILVDLQLPDIDGLEVCRRLRERCDTPVIAFTDAGTELDRVLGLEAGADSCLDSPVELRELIARVEAINRRAGLRAGPGRADTTVLEAGDLRINVAAREVTVGGRAVELTRKEFDLLVFLARHVETVVTRQRLMAEIWDDPRSLSSRASRTVDTHISSLRGKLGGSDRIHTVRGVGFCLVPRPASPEPPVPHQRRSLVFPDLTLNYG
ncbi:response regulator transcription factor [Micromonospora sp. NPDC005203]|uniref:response regulator transcription factor n=1 Tax=Micromonospora sp. NPDC005203 TaxID=3364226 RepID=UPI0036B4F967